jgi:hypothetical protein
MVELKFVADNYGGLMKAICSYVEDAAGATAACVASQPAVAPAPAVEEAKAPSRKRAAKAPPAQEPVGNGGVEAVPEAPAPEAPAPEKEPADLKARLIAYANKHGFDKATALVGQAQTGAAKFRDLQPEALPALDLLLQEAGL